jgi:uncharacterized protein YbjT (DUF2867 family)
MASVLILGATGFVGSQLARWLVDRGHIVRCLVRDGSRARASALGQVEIIEGDVLDPDTLGAAIEHIDVVYYLIHSMAAGKGAFEELDCRAAQNVAQAANAAGVGRIIYLGGLGRRDGDQSPHLRSRHQVADILRTSDVPVTEFRAAVVAGPGGISFEMVHHLVNRLPFMICPRWVDIKTQPIALEDVLRYLGECLEKPETAGKIIDIGGPDVLTYRDMMLIVARVLGLRRFLVRVPVLTPRLSSYWLKLVTPLPVATARALIESVRYETVCENDLAQRYFGFPTEPFESAARRALAPVRAENPVAIDPAADNESHIIDPTHLKIDRRTADATVRSDRLFGVVAAIGGATGWYYADWLWRLRGAIDRLLGGIGLRKGRRHPVEIAVGDTVDFWRVERYDPGKRLLLHAEMNVWGEAWLDFAVEPISDSLSRLIQTARYYPRGLFGLIYWYVVLPVHAIVFRGMVAAISRRAETVEQANASMD